MTQYFLHGWCVGALSQDNRDFFSTLVMAPRKESIRILIIPFARERSRWDKKFEEIKERFFEVAEWKEIKIILSESDIQKCQEEIRKADIIFIWWGETEVLQAQLEKIEDFKEIISWKVVAGSSAGALIFSKYYYENDTHSYHNGFWFLDCGIICHWRNQEKELAHIKKYWWVNKVLCIAEWKYLILEC